MALAMRGKLPPKEPAAKIQDPKSICLQTNDLTSETQKGNVVNVKSKGIAAPAVPRCDQTNQVLPEETLEERIS
jgi:hypothetical protein